MKYNTLVSNQTSFYTQENDEGDSGIKGGKLFPSEEVMSTAPGKRVHLLNPKFEEDKRLIQKYYTEYSEPRELSEEEYEKKQRLLSRIMARYPNFLNVIETIESAAGGFVDLTPFVPVVGICGAGKPSKTYPEGSGYMIAEDDLRDGSYVAVDCYKCLKLHYMNTMEYEEQSIPERNFEPSNQKPSYSSFGPLRKEDDFNLYDPEDFLYINNVDNVFVFYMANQFDGKKRVRWHIKIPEDEDWETLVPQYKEYFQSLGINVHNRWYAPEETYERRTKEGEEGRHIMIPMGRYGIFGGDNKASTEKLSKEYQVPIEEDNLDWVDDYFKSSSNPWRVNEKSNRKTQQAKKKPKQRNFILELLSQDDLIGVYQDAYDRASEVREFILEASAEFARLLALVPIDVFVSLNPKAKGRENKIISSARGKLWDLIARKRRGEINSYKQKLKAAKIRKSQKSKMKEFIQNTKEKLLANGFNAVAAGREANKQAKLILKFNRGRFPESERELRIVVSRIAGSGESMFQGFSPDQNKPMLNNPKHSNRVLPLLERIEELDTLFLELERDYAKDRTRRHR